VEALLLPKGLATLTEIGTGNFSKRNIECRFNVSSLDVVIFRIGMTERISNVCNEIRYVIDFFCPFYIIDECDTR